MSGLLRAGRLFRREWLRAISLGCIAVFAILPLVTLAFHVTGQDLRFALGDRSFREAVRIVVQRFEAQSGCRVEVPSYGNQEDLSPRQRLQVIFIIQAALSNVRKHARASRVRIDLESGADYVVSVTDDGQGIDPALLAERQKTHVGMNIMRERASRIGATVEVSSVQPSGTCVRLTIPARERVAH